MRRPCFSSPVHDVSCDESDSLPIKVTLYVVNIFVVGVSIHAKTNPHTHTGTINRDLVHMFADTCSQFAADHIAESVASVNRINIVLYTHSISKYIQQTDTACLNFILDSSAQSNHRDRERDPSIQLTSSGTTSSMGLATMMVSCRTNNKWICGRPLHCHSYRHAHATNSPKRILFNISFILALN